MSTYRVYAELTISTVRTVQANNETEAEDMVLSEGFPGVMFLDHTYPDAGDWECAEVELVEDSP